MLAFATMSVADLTWVQVLALAVFVTHNAESPRVVVPCAAPSAEVADIAEQGSTFGHIDKLTPELGVLDVCKLALFVRPGRSATVNIQFDGVHWLVSAASMIEIASDGFASPIAAEVPRESTRTGLAGGAGSESNTERCS